MAVICTRTGIGFFLRLVGNRITTYEEWTRDGDQWSVHLTSTFKNKRITFKLNEEFDEETLDGRKVKVSHDATPSVQYLCALKSPYVPHPVYHKFPQRCL